MSTSKKSMLRNIALFLIISSLLSLNVFAGEEPIDLTPPVTEKSYSQPNIPTVLQVPSCNGDVDVNGHFISIATKVIFNASDEDSGVDSTSYAVLVPVECEEEFDEVELVGLNDSEIYNDNETCAFAVDNGRTEEVETQECVQTFWKLKDEIMDGEDFLEYDETFNISQESIHKICFFSEDTEGNEEELQCQVVGVDNSTPATRKTYGEPNEAGLIEVLACNYGPVNVSGHFISTATTVTLNAEDPEPHPSQVAGTFLEIKIPSSDSCYGSLEYVGLNDSNIYQGVYSQQECELALDNPETEEQETQSCVATYWNTINESDYSGPFTVLEESVHKICFFSEDNVQNQEALQCQVVLVDDNDPVINGTVVLREIIDIENYEEQTRDFNDPKCTLILANVTETHDVDVEFDIKGLLQRMFADISDFGSFNADNYEDYLNERNEFFECESDNGFRQCEYVFCPSEHIDQLSNFDVFFDVFEDEEDFDAFLKFISEALLLGKFEVNITATDASGKEAQTKVNVTIVDLTVPLESGWNLRSTPLTLEADKIWTTKGIDWVLDWNASSQTWLDVTGSNVQVPLRAYYMHATQRNQYGIIFERDVSIPSSQLHKGWNLVGLALPLEDFYHSPSSCCIDCEHQYNCHVTTLEGSFEDDQLCVGEAFAPVVYDSNSNRGIDTVIALPEDLSYSACDDRECFGYWSMSQQPKLWIPDIRDEGASPRNKCENLNTGASGSTFHVKNFGGYWAFMNNPDLLPGFTSTPLPIDSD